MFRSGDTIVITKADIEEAKSQPLPPNEYLGLKLADFMQDIVNYHVLQATQAALEYCLKDLKSKHDYRVVYRTEEELTHFRKACLSCAYNDDGSCSCFDPKSICCPYAEEGE